MKVAKDAKDIFATTSKKNLVKTNENKTEAKQMVTSRGQLVNSSAVFTPNYSQSLANHLPQLFSYSEEAATVLGSSDPPVMVSCFSSFWWWCCFWRRCTTTHLLALPLLVQESPAGAVCTRSAPNPSPKQLIAPGCCHPVLLVARKIHWKIVSGESWPNF